MGGGVVSATGSQQGKQHAVGLGARLVVDPVGISEPLEIAQVPNPQRQPMLTCLGL